ncbi:hypothetical protein EZV62_005370 [Acer yangbiense]|uniref:NAC domain-containing protein n=1 Tax=Acer yangbiense TaxID=1000413 RepID=A0A5C7IMM9_9ROSI|nr:hypothetical protein EZV62_005370 [Acer yangbiense]
MEEENGQGRMMVRPEEQQKYMRFPLGYRFFPTDRELIIEYLRKKVYNQPLPFDDIYDVEINEYTPLQLFGNSGASFASSIYGQRRKRVLHLWPWAHGGRESLLQRWRTTPPPTMSNPTLASPEEDQFSSGVGRGIQHWKFLPTLASRLLTPEEDPSFGEVGG